MQLVKKYIEALRFDLMPSEEREDLLDAIKELNSFVIISSSKETKVHHTNLKRSCENTQDITLDLPFKVCSFEDINSAKCFYYSDNGNKTETKYRMNSVIVSERGPLDYKIWFSDFVNNKGYCITKERSGNLYFHVLAIIKSAYIDTINNSDLGILNTKNKIRIKSKNTKIKAKVIRKVVYVSDKKIKPKKINGNVINWDYSHRFEVRGHWRIVKGLGKDRNGEYCIKGFTWVNSHLKGSQDLPLIKKTRIV